MTDSNKSNRNSFISNEKPDRPAIHWISQVMGWRKLYIVLLMLLQLAIGAISVGYAVILRGLIDAAVAGEEALFFQWVIRFVLMILIQLVLGALNRFLGEYTRATTENCLKDRMVQFILNRDYASVTAVHSGEWMNRLTSDTVVVADSVSQILPGASGMLIRLVGALVLLLMLYPKFVYVFLPGGLIILLTTTIFRKKLKRLHKEVQEADGGLRVFLQECISSLLVIHTFAQEKRTVEEAGEKMEQHKEIRIRRNHFSNFTNTGFAAVMNGAYVLIAGVCGYGILKGTMSYGTLMAMIQLFGQIQSPVANITGYIPQYYAMTASAERLMEIETFDEDLTEQPKTLEEVKSFYEKEMQSLCFQNVSFTYKRRMSGAGQEVPVVLSNVNLEIPKKSCTAFTGPSGCGKSTLLKLMLSLYPLDSGERILRMKDAEDAEDAVPLTASWRRLFAYVPQGNQLMSGTIREILTFRERNEMQEKKRIWQALRIADAEGFVRALPDGIDTVLGEHGMGLSEGQMQRIAIARAIFAGNPILLLDESTSALDEETERTILKNLQEMTDKTILIVTHRKAVLDICDREICFSEKQVLTKVRRRKGN